MSGREKSKAVLLISVATILFALATPGTGLDERFENVLWDLRLSWTAQPQSADKRIKLIVIDQGSLDYFDQEQSITWPWPRPVYIPVINFLERAGAKGIAFDILFTESSVHGVEDDNQFSAAVKAKIPITIATSFSSSDRKIDEEKLKLFSEKQLSLDKSSGFAKRYLTSPLTLDFDSATLPLPELIKNSTSLGVVNASPDQDGVFRHYKPGAFMGHIPALGLPFALYEDTRSPTDPEPKIAEFLDDSGRLIVNFHGASNTYPTYNFVKIIQSELALESGQKPEVDPSEFRDAWVFVGVWAPGLLDLRPIPLDKVYRGVEFNATVLDNLANRSFIRRVSGSVSAVVSSVFVVLACSIITLSSSALTQLLFTLTLGGLLLGLGFFLAAQGYWLPLSSPILGIVVGSVGSLLYQYQSEGKQRRFLKTAFGRYVSPTVIEQIINNPAKLALGGERRELTIFFSDIQGFTSISEKMEPGKLVQLLNLFLSEMTNIIQDEGGTVDKYIGDAIVAFWNAPLPVEDHALRGVRSAMRCQAKLKELEKKFISEFGVPIRMRIGLNTGSVTVGNVGSRDRFNYTMVGDAANLASRLEGANKFFGTYCMMAEATFLKVSNQIRARELGSIRVVGKDQVLRIFEPLTSNQMADAALSSYNSAREAFERGELEQALSIFAGLAQDPVSKKYADQIKELLANGGPGSKFSPVWNLETK